MKKCIYCGIDVHEESVIDFCGGCGVKVWGDKMFLTIKKNMENARANGDLCLDHGFNENSSRD
jgi:hypothetical protein